MVLLIYRSLAEDIYLYDDAVAELRKKELNTGMLAISISTGMVEKWLQRNPESGGLVGMPPSVSSFDVGAVLDVLRVSPHNDGWLNRWTKNVPALHALLMNDVRGNRSIECQRYHNEHVLQTTAHAGITERLCILHLNTLSVFVDWVVLEYVFDGHVALRVWTDRLEPVLHMKLD